jgi:hypothetical protein
MGKKDKSTTTAARTLRYAIGAPSTAALPLNSCSSPTGVSPDIEFLSYIHGRKIVFNYIESVNFLPYYLLWLFRLTILTRGN